MTRDDLKTWIARRELKQHEAAALLGLTVDALRERLYGRVDVDPQTAIIVQMLDERANRG